MGTEITCQRCGFSNPELSHFCGGCGTSLAGCPACGAESLPEARFCIGCGAALTNAADAPSARRTVSILFIDLVGSTALQERLDAEVAGRVIDRFLDEMTRAVTDHGGIVVKGTGDGLMAMWGMPTVGEQDALHAVQCAWTMHVRLASLNVELQRDRGVTLAMRAGVNTGEVVTRPNGDPVGDPVNIAARLEAAAPPGGVLIGPTTRALVRGDVALEQAGALELKGKADPVRAFHVRGLAAVERRRVDAPFVARSTELTRLRAAFDAAVAVGGCRLVSVVGAPGVGKSRLAAEFATRVADEAIVVSGRCEPTGEGITLLPVAEVLRELAGIAEGDSRERSLAKLRALLPAEDADRERVVQRAGGVLGLTSAAPPEETFWALRRLLEAAAAARPLVIVLDDVHWGRPLFLDLLEHLAAWGRSGAVLLLALARPEMREVRATLTDRSAHVADVLELAALNPVASQQLIGGLLGDGGGVPARLAQRLLETTGGNPLFLGETLRMLIDDGVLLHTRDGWDTSVAPDAVEVPPTISALLAVRIDRLGTDERTVVERAAVIGKSFYRGAVAALSPAPVAAGVDAHLESLRRSELVEPEGTYWIDEPVFRFHHVLIRDAAYRRLLKQARAELHERFADWLEQKAGDRVVEHEELVGYHLEQAYQLRRQLGPPDAHGRALGARAAVLLASSGRRALAREDLPAAANLLTRALACGDGADPLLLTDLAEAQLCAADADGAARTVRALGDVAARTGQPGLDARARVAAAELGRLTGALGLGDAERELAAVAAVLEAVHDDAGLAKALELLARALAPQGRIAEAEAVLDRALTAARNAGDQRRVTAVLSAAPLVALYGPSPVRRASGRCLDVVRIMRMSHGNRHVEARALRCQAVLEAMRGRGDAARKILDGAQMTFEELGLTLDLHELDTFAGQVELLLGDPAAAELRLRRACDGLRGLGVNAAYPLAMLGAALADQGRHDEALAVTAESEASAGDDLQANAAWLRVRAQVQAARGERIEAIALARRAVDLADGTDALADHALCLLALAVALDAAGETVEARSTAACAAAMFDAKGHEVGAAAARALVGETAPAARLGDTRPDEQQPAAALRHDRNDRLAIHRGYVDAFNARDHDAMRELYRADARICDRRLISGGEMDVDAYFASFRSLDDMVGERSMRTVEVLAVGTRAYLVRDIVLADFGGGETVVADYLTVPVVEDDLLVAADAFDPDDLDAAVRTLARADLDAVTPALVVRSGITGDEASAAAWIDAVRDHLDPEEPAAAAATGVSGGVDLQDRPELDAHRRYVAAANARDWAALRTCFEPAALIEDHRRASAGTMTVDEFVGYCSGLDQLAAEWTLQTSEVFCIGERIYATRDRHEGVVEGVPLLLSDYVCLVRVRDGLMAHCVAYDPDQLALVVREVARQECDVVTPQLLLRTGIVADAAAAAAWVAAVRDGIDPDDDRLAFGLGAAGVTRARIQAMNTRDYERVAAGLDPCVVMRERRRLTGGRHLGPEGFVRAAQQTAGVVESFAYEMQVLDADDTTLLARMRFRGTVAGGGGAIVGDFLAVELARDGRGLRIDLYDIEDEALARERLGQLRGMSLAELVAADLDEAQAAGDAELAAHLAGPGGSPDR